MSLWIDTGGLAGAQALFGLAPIERLRRSVGAGRSGVVISGTPAPWPGARVEASGAALGARLRQALARAEGPITALDGSHVVDPRLIRFLERVAEPCVAQRGDGRLRAVVLRLTPAVAGAIPEQAQTLADVADALLAAGKAEILDESRFPAYIDKLRRTLPYWIHAVPDAATRDALERRLFWDNYKGSTDLLTRYVYPPLVWPLTRLCTRFGIHPNTVTVLSIILAFAAVPLWCQGQWLLGFLCAYGMSVLDSVDGKVARLTLTDSKIGNLLDHGLDQVHPPFWYFAWAWGLGAREWMDPLYQAAVVFIALYIADRLVLMVAKLRIGHALHSSTPLDEQVRSIIARRNITMTVMAFALIPGWGEAGFYLVTAWQGLTLLWHSWRTLWLGFITTEHRTVR